MSTKSSRKGLRAGTMAPRSRQQLRRTLMVEDLAGAVARRLQGERRRAAVLGRSRLAAPFPVFRLAGAITRQLGDPWRSHRLPAQGLASAIARKLGWGCGKIAVPAVLRAIEHELFRQGLRPAA